MKPLFIILLFCCAALVGFSQSALPDPIQDTSAKKGNGYHVFSARVRKIDTIMFVDRSYAANSAMPAKHFQMIRIRFSKKRKLASDLRKIPCVLMPLVQEEHSCSFDFKTGSDYKVYAMYTRYSSPSALRKYRKYWLQLDCNRLPEIL